MRQTVQCPAKIDFFPRFSSLCCILVWWLNISGWEQGRRERQQLLLRRLAWSILLKLQTSIELDLFKKTDFDRLIFHDPSSLFFTPLFFTLLLTEIVQFSVLYRNKWNFFSNFFPSWGNEIDLEKKFRYFLSLLFIVFLSFVH